MTEPNEIRSNRLGLLQSIKDNFDDMCKRASFWGRELNASSRFYCTDPLKAEILNQVEIYCKDNDWFEYEAREFLETNKYWGCLLDGDKTVIDKMIMELGKK